MDILRKDELFIILENLNDRSLLNFCVTSKYAKEICQNETFWRNRTASRFGEDSLKFKEADRSWKDYYLNIVRFLSLGEDKPEDAINYAIREDKPDAVKYFLGKGTNLDDLDTLLFIASIGGNMRIIQILIDEGANDWNLGMYGAALGGHLDLVKYFISKGANLWQIGMNYAKRGGHSDIVKYFSKKINE